MRGRVLESERVWLWSIVIVGAFLRLYRLDYQSLWLDEGLQYYVATNNGISEILFSQIRSFHPPLSFLINHALLQIGESEFFLRLPSALFGIVTLPVFYILARELTSGRVALLSTLLLAVSPFHIWYSQEGRMYSEVLFFSLLSSVLLLEAVKRREARWWVYYALVSAVGMYTQVFMVLALLAQFFWVLLYHRDRLIAHTASGVTIFVLFLPWIIFLPWVRRFLDRVSGHGLGAGAPVGSQAAFRAGFSWESIPYTFFSYSSGFSIGPTVAELHENRSLGFILQFVPEILLVTVIFGPLLLLGVPAVYKLFGAKFISFCLLGFSIPIFAALLYALVPRATYNVRYTVVGFPHFCIFLGTGLTYIFQKSRPVGVAFLLGILAISSASLANHYFNPRYAKEDIRSAVVFWRSVSRAEPLLSYQSYPVVSVYLREAEKERHSLVTGDVVSKVNLFFSKTEAPSIYILLARDWRNLQENSIRDAFSVDLEKSFQGVKILKISNSRKAHDSAGVL
jgi:4-amino-4-deoxy-L-arabinose transferase-like glycosyltransferase